MNLPANIYMYPLFGAIMVTLFGALMAKPRVTKVTDTSLVYNGVDKPFDNNVSNMLYRWSFQKPFVWFIPETPTHPSAINRNSIIARSEMTKKLDYRAFAVLQMVLLMAALSLTLVVYLFLLQGDLLFRVLFNINITDTGNLNAVSIMIGIILLTMAFIPNIYIKYLANKKTEAFVADLPLLQLFLILMIRSKRPIGETLYTLSKTDGRYRNIFATGYRIFLRDKDAGFNYLESAFARTSFRDSINVLATCDEYSREYGAESLQAKMPTLLDDVAAAKKNRGVLRGLLSEGSIALPFIAVMLLTVGPILSGVMKSMNTIFSF